MVTFFITSFFILAVLAIALYFWQKPAASSDVEALRPPPGRGLFIDGASDSQDMAQISAESASQAAANAVTRRRELLERAAAGDNSTLLEAHRAGDAEAYDEALTLLLAAADSDPKLLALVSYVARHELHVNKELAERVIDSYTRAPDRSATAKMLHIAALADDAAVYQNAIETALEFWRAGRLPEVSAPELRAILDGEFWILSSPTRNSGAGFLLKRALAGARRELEAAQND
jgi:hypothetical protein